MTDIVSLVRFAIHQDDQLVPFAEQVEERFRLAGTAGERAGSVHGRAARVAPRHQGPHRRELRDREGRLRGRAVRAEGRASVVHAGSSAKTARALLDHLNRELVA